MEHEALPALARERVDLLLVARRSERRRHGSLGLAALKERRPVRAREDADLAHDRADRLHVAPVDALSLAEDVLADDVYLRSSNPSLMSFSMAAYSASPSSDLRVSASRLLIALYAS